MLCQCPTLRQLATFSEEVLPSPLICWSFLTIDLICSVNNSCFLSSSALQRVRKSWLNLPSWWVITAYFTKWFDYFMICDLNMIFMIRTKCQNILRWSGQNANQKVGTDKMPTTKKIQTKCQPLVGIMSGLFSVVGILSAPNFWLAFCPDHLNMFWHFVGIMKITFQITFH